MKRCILLISRALYSSLLGQNFTADVADSVCECLGDKIMISENEHFNEKLSNWIIWFSGKDSAQLKNSIDTNSFTSLGSDFYKDGNIIYLHYSVCNEGIHTLFSADTSSFKVLGWYALYKSKVYYYNRGLLEADSSNVNIFENHA